MAFNFSFTDAAKADLDEILSYISAELANPTAASSFFDSIEKTISQLVEFPQSGAIVENEFITAENIRKVPVGNYMLYYTPDRIPSTIVIIRIIYAKRSPEWISSQLIWIQPLAFAGGFFLLRITLSSFKDRGSTCTFPKLRMRHSFRKMIKIF